MRSLLSDLTLFIVTILSYWQAYATGGIVTGAVGLFERLTEWRLTKRAYVTLFVATFLLASFFFSWRDERKVRLETQASLNATVEGLRAQLPKLRGEIIFLQAGQLDIDSPATTTFTVLAGVTNIGTTPTIAQDWTCYLDIPGKGRIYGWGRAIPDSVTLPTDIPMVYGRVDALYDKAIRTPIPSGGKVVGFLLYGFAVTKAELLSSDSSTITVEFRDVLDHVYSMTQPYKKGLHYRGTYADVPGLTRPTNVPPPSPTISP